MRQSGSISYKKTVFAFCLIIDVLLPYIPLDLFFKYVLEYEVYYEVNNLRLFFSTFILLKEVKSFLFPQAFTIND